LLAGETLNDAERQATGGHPETYRVLFLAHCTREKGLFDALDGVALANAELARTNSPMRIQLTVAGEFVNREEQVEFEQRIAQPDLTHGFVSGGRQGCVEYIGFAGGETKWRQFTECDCFCFPTYYYAESFGLVVIEAMACGMAVVASAWRTIPELLTPDYPGLVPPRAPDQVAKAILGLMPQPPGGGLRRHFLQHFTIEQHLKKLAAAIRDAETAQAEMGKDYSAPAK
jgi:glycosyltransferase involved in cell wall biosynthesis